ncbi:DUF4167 domain-containing protein [Maricaulis virginensis]|uniref:DUF4167 domain-containing protein n=1 Tax=Maricaulis virginensis TaxID=144022 RepID=A0A9W6MMJ9_9PROT|nr:DUF4167 domain-containing protein [Maricaulis virginensis]GLK51252.1 hypothetical protein GCM10017621_07600 [Maricaulis virginensis]
MKRQRGRGRKSGNSANRSYESNGPEVKIRGNASQIYDKYLQLARDASSAGDRVRAENLYQHAEHYYRILQASQPRREPGQDDNGDNAEANGDDEDNDDMSYGSNGGGSNGGHSNNGSGNDQGGDREREPRRGRGRQRQQRPSDRGGEKEDPLGVVTPEAEKPAAEEAKPDAKAEDGEDGARRRTRRPRRTKAEIAADKAAAEAALESASASADGKTGGGDDSESEAA